MTHRLNLFTCYVFAILGRRAIANPFVMNLDTVSRLTGTMLTRIRQHLSQRHDDEEGQGMTEYALILVLIAVVVIVVLTVVGQQVNNVFSNISSGLGT
jgi:pilus assembly protein Flp/PilA